ncbi:hypothetical protein ACN47E_009377 [Coniothyrium glycines]
MPAANKSSPDSSRGDEITTELIHDGKLRFVVPPYEAASTEEGTFSAAGEQKSATISRPFYRIYTQNTIQVQGPTIGIL